MVRENWKKKQKWIPLYVLSANSIELSAETKLEIIQWRRFEMHRKKLMPTNNCFALLLSYYLCASKGGEREGCFGPTINATTGNR